MCVHGDTGSTHFQSKSVSCAHSKDNNVTECLSRRGQERNYTPHQQGSQRKLQPANSVTQQHSRNSHNDTTTTKMWSFTRIVVSFNSQKENQTGSRRVSVEGSAGGTSEEQGERSNTVERLGVLTVKG